MGKAASALMAPLAAIALGGAASAPATEPPEHETSHTVIRAVVPRDDAERRDVAFITGALRESDIELPRTGEYEYSCTSYSGVTLGWNDKIEQACHGWMEVYISGQQVAHYCPDLSPSPSSPTASAFPAWASGQRAPQPTNRTSLPRV